MPSSLRAPRKRLGLQSPYIPDSSLRTKFYETIPGSIWNSMECNLLGFSEWCLSEDAVKNFRVQRVAWFREGFCAVLLGIALTLFTACAADEAEDDFGISELEASKSGDQDHHRIDTNGKDIKFIGTAENPESLEFDGRNISGEKVSLKLTDLKASYESGLFAGHTAVLTGVSSGPATLEFRLHYCHVGQCAKKVDRTHTIDAAGEFEFRFDYARISAGRMVGNRIGVHTFSAKKITRTRWIEKQEKEE